jgi:DtxR family Mn-dependent transcriptional regulator
MSGEQVIIRQVSDWEREQLSYLQALGLVPGTHVTLLERAPFGGPLTLQLGQKTVAIACAVAQEIGVASASLTRFLGKIGTTFEGESQS